MLGARQDQGGGAGSGEWPAGAGSGGMGKGSEERVRRLYGFISFYLCLSPSSP